MNESGVTGYATLTGGDGSYFAVYKDGLVNPYGSYADYEYYQKQTGDLMMEQSSAEVLIEFQ